MKLQIVLTLSLLVKSSRSFAPKASLTSTSTSKATHQSSSFHLRATEVDAPSDVEAEELTAEYEVIDDSETLRNELLYTAKSLTEESPTGIFLTTPPAMEKFTNAASALEAITPTMTERQKELLIGDWVLLATSRSLKATNVRVPKEMKRLPFNLKTPKLSDPIRNSVTVLQRIRSEGEETNEIDRIDHVIQYTPLTLMDLIPENSLLSVIRGWNVNPLEVSGSKVTLLHNAEIESVEPVLRTKLNLKSVVVNVAGKSQYLDPSGADILGLNIPSLGEFANGAAFDSTYIDENIRISRGTIGFLEEVRVFVREGFNMEDFLEAGYESLMEKTEEEEMTEVEVRLEKIGDAVTNVVGAVQSLDKDVRDTVGKDFETVGKKVDEVRGTIAEGVKDVQTVVEDDLKKVGKAVNDVRAAVVGETVEEVDAEETVVDVEVVETVEATTEEEETETENETEDEE